MIIVDMNLIYPSFSRLCWTGDGDNDDGNDDDGDGDYDGDDDGDENDGCWTFAFVHQRRQNCKPHFSPFTPRSHLILTKV